jgi:hypothetical protein
MNIVFVPRQMIQQDFRTSALQIWRNFFSYFWDFKVY